EQDRQRHVDKVPADRSLRQSGLSGCHGVLEKRRVSGLPRGFGGRARQRLKRHNYDGTPIDLQSAWIRLIRSHLRVIMRAVCTSSRCAAMSWKKLSSRVAFDNPWITVFEDRVINPGGG